MTQNSTFPIPPTPSPFFLSQLLLLELKHLSNPSNCPSGVYITPATTPPSPHMLYGVIFIPSGPYASSIFRFQIQLPQTYPNSPPTFRFLNQILHPLVSKAGNFTPTNWTPGVSFLSHGLSQLKQIFCSTNLNGFEQQEIINQEAWRMFTTEKQKFERIVTESAENSGKEGILFDCIVEGMGVKFNGMGQEEFERVKREMIGKSQGELHRLQQAIQELKSMEGNCYS